MLWTREFLGVVGCEGVQIGCCRKFRRGWNFPLRIILEGIQDLRKVWFAPVGPCRSPPGLCEGSGHVMSSCILLSQSSMTNRSFTGFVTHVLVLFAGYDITICDLRVERRTFCRRCKAGRSATPVHGHIYSCGRQVFSGSFRKQRYQGLPSDPGVLCRSCAQATRQDLLDWDAGPGRGAAAGRYARRRRRACATQREPDFEARIRPPHHHGGCGSRSWDLPDAGLPLPTLRVQIQNLGISAGVRRRSCRHFGVNFRGISGWPKLVCSAPALSPVCCCHHATCRVEMGPIYRYTSTLKYPATTPTRPR